MQIPTPLRLASCTIIIALAAAASATSAGATPDADIFDFTSAAEFCDNSPIDNFEGIWEFPDDETSVMIRKSRWDKHSYDIIILSSPDCRLHGGHLLGTAKRGAEAGKFKISLFTRISRDILSDPGECLGELNSESDTFLFYPKKLKISLRSISILPKFWRMLRVKIDNPLDKLKRGMVKIYPINPGKSDGFSNPIYF